MNLKHVAKRVLPPIVFDAARYLRHGVPSPEIPEWEYVPAGWRTEQPQIKGWDVESVLEAQKAKLPRWLRFVHGTGPLAVQFESPTLSDENFLGHNTLMSYAYVLALATRKADRFSMPDFGGGIGYYSVLNKALVPEVQIDYHCKDMSSFCHYGRTLFPEATFYDNEEDCIKRTYDLVLVSNSLQYIENWQRAISRLAPVSRFFLFVTRLTTVKSAPSFVAVQPGYRYGHNTEYLCWFLNRNEFLDYMSTLQMELVREFLLHKVHEIRNGPEQGDFRGFLFRPKRGSVDRTTSDSTEAQLLVSGCPGSSRRGGSPGGFHLYVVLKAFGGSALAAFISTLF